MIFKRISQLATAGLCALALGCSSNETKTAPQPPQKPLPESIQAAISCPFRTSANLGRDVYRHPVETLTFFGLQPNMTVVEVSPGGGWYTEILAPLLAKNGHFIAAYPHGNSTESDNNWKKLNDWVAANPPMPATVTFSNFSPEDKGDIAPAESADMVLTFRNVHNWMMKHTENEAFASFYRALKHGGTLGVVEHRAKAKGKEKPESGYLSEKKVIALAKKAGFKLVSQSEINANPKDTKNYPQGVWTLPPSYKLGDKDHDKYAAIGESDRMTLKFTKP